MTQKRFFQTCVALLTTLVAFLPRSDAAEVADANTRFEPKTVKEVRIDDRFWSPKLKVLREATLPNAWKYVDGAVEDLDHAARRAGPGRDGVPWNEANLYKVMEGAAFVLAHWPEQPDVVDQPAPPQPALPVRASLSAHLDAIIAMMQTAQANNDGYLHAYVSNRPGKKQWDEYPLAPWQSLMALHDGFTAGHLCEAAVAHYQATGKTSMLEVARKVAEQAHRHFVLGKNRGYCGHAGFELGLAELYRVTGDRRALELSRYFVHQRGTGAFGPLGEKAAYFQDDFPIEKQTAINGHAVRALFYYTGVADLALCGDRDLCPAIFRVWENTVKRKLYVIGGVGASADAGGGEGFSPHDYDLPNECYCESCASCAMVNMAHRMARLTGDATAADELERSLYNAVLHGVSLDGKTSYYQNPLNFTPRPPDQKQQRYNSWVCCPPNLMRTLAGLGRYVYGQKDRDLFVNLFLGSSCEFKLAGAPVRLTMTTPNYPFEGRVAIAVKSAAPQPFALHVRLPEWCQKCPLEINGKAVAEPRMAKGYFVVERTWTDGDTLTLDLAMPAVRIEAHPSVLADRGRVCIQRGPVIFALEGIDNGANQEPVLAADPDLRAEYRGDLLGGVEVIHARAADGKPLQFIPFYALANRGESWQRVWIGQENKSVRKEGWEGRLYREYRP